MNQVNLRGRLAANPKTNVTTVNGKELSSATFTLAVPDKSRKNEDGSFNTDFIRITTFGKTADVASRFLSKGSEIIAVGKIHSYKYTKDNKTVYGVEVISSSIEFVSKCAAADDYSFMDSVQEEEMPFE